MCAPMSFGSLRHSLVERTRAFRAFAANEKKGSRGASECPCSRNIPCALSWRLRCGRHNSFGVARSTTKRPVDNEPESVRLDGRLDHKRR